jgi:hypothetical protein
MHDTNKVTPLRVAEDFYALGFRLFAARRSEPVIDTGARAEWLTTPPSAKPAPPIRRGSFADYTLEFPEAAG